MQWSTLALTSKRELLPMMTSIVFKTDLHLVISLEMTFASLRKGHWQRTEQHESFRHCVILNVHMRSYSDTRSELIMSRDMIFPTMVCTTSKASDQPAHTRSLIRAFASRLNTL